MDWIKLIMLCFLACLVQGHAHISHFIIDGQIYQGFRSDKYAQDPSASPPSAAWTVSVADNGFVDELDHPDIICHRNASPGTLSVDIIAGHTVEIQWTQWPIHQGPVLSYLAECLNKSCQNVDKRKLSWFKIAEAGLISTASCNERGNTGCWALDRLRNENNRWLVQIPYNLKAGSYVLRHEVINLDIFNLPQNYPACINLNIIGNGSASAPSGEVGTSLYVSAEPGFRYNIYEPQTSAYLIPGPRIAPNLDNQLGNPITKSKLTIRSRKRRSEAESSALSKSDY